jgi:hypothetical protein
VVSAIRLCAKGERGERGVEDRPVVVGVGELTCSQPSGNSHTHTLTHGHILSRVRVGQEDALGLGEWPRPSLQSWSDCGALAGSENEDMDCMVWTCG